MLLIQNEKQLMTLLHQFRPDYYYYDVCFAYKRIIRFDPNHYGHLNYQLTKEMMDHLWAYDQYSRRKYNLDIITFSEAQWMPHKFDPEEAVEYLDPYFLKRKLTLLAS